MQYGPAWIFANPGTTGFTFKKIFYSNLYIQTQFYFGISYDLRATPTAAGPSSSKRSVLWRTCGFAALGFDCCVVVGAVSGACFV